MKNKNLETKVKKLVSFLSNKKEHQDYATNAILTKILEAINDLKQTSLNAGLG